VLEQEDAYSSVCVAYTLTRSVCGEKGREEDDLGDGEEDREAKVSGHRRQIKRWGLGHRRRGKERSLEEI
jgi:hypothetical protein